MRYSSGEAPGMQSALVHVNSMTSRTAVWHSTPDNSPQRNVTAVRLVLLTRTRTCRHAL